MAGWRSSTRRALLLTSAIMLPVENLPVRCCCAAHKVATPQRAVAPTATGCCCCQSATTPDLQPPCCRPRGRPSASRSVDRSCCKCARVPTRVASVEYLRTWSPDIVWQPLCMGCSTTSVVGTICRCGHFHGVGPPRAAPVLDRCIAFSCLII